MKKEKAIKTLCLMTITVRRIQGGRGERQDTSTYAVYWGLTPVRVMMEPVRLMHDQAPSNIMPN